MRERGVAIEGVEVAKQILYSGGWETVTCAVSSAH